MYCLVMTARQNDMVLIGGVREMMLVVGVAWMRLQKVLKFEVSHFVPSSASLSVLFTGMRFGRKLTTVTNTLRCMH